MCLVDTLDTETIENRDGLEMLLCSEETKNERQEHLYLHVYSNFSSNDLSSNGVNPLNTVRTLSTHFPVRHLGT